MKGYELSTDYNQLWALIQEGYRVPAWRPTNTEKKDLLEVYSDLRLDFEISFGNRIISKGFGVPLFHHTCRLIGLQFIVPYKQ